MKEGFVPRKGKVYPLSRKEREEVREFIMANYERELRMGGDIRRRGKVESAMEFIERMKKVHKEARAMLKKAQEDMKKQADRRRKETKDWKKREIKYY